MDQFRKIISFSQNHWIKHQQTIWMTLQHCVTVPNFLTGTRTKAGTRNMTGLGPGPSPGPEI